MKIGAIIQTKRDRYLFTIAISAMLYGFFLARSFYHDDAFISLRYVYNLVNHKSITWNLGEYVEGYTNFLYVCATALLNWLGLEIIFASRILGVISYVIVVLLTLRFIIPSQKKYQPNTALSFLLATLLLLSNMNMITWSLSGLETLMATAWLTAAAIYFLNYLNAPNLKYCKIKSLVLSSICFVMASLTRLDSGLILAVSGLFLLHHLHQQAIPIKEKWQLVGVFSLPGVIFIPYFLGKWLYYGEILPNTFYAKAGEFDLMSLGYGLKYVLQYLVKPPFVYLILITLYFKNRSTKQSNNTNYLFLLIGIHLIYVLYVGGDHMRAGRFFVPMVPITIICIYQLLSIEIANWQEKTRNRATKSLVCWVILQSLFFSVVIIREDPAASMGRITGNYISEHWPENSLIASNAAGAQPFFALNHRFIDMLGLNDKHIARRKMAVNYDLRGTIWPGHRKGDGAYVLERDPDYIIAGPPEGTIVEKRPWFMTDYELSNIPDFYKKYEMKKVNIDFTDVSYYQLFGSPKTGTLKFIFYQRRKERKPSKIEN